MILALPEGPVDPQSTWIGKWGALHLSRSAACPDAKPTLRSGAKHARTVSLARRVRKLLVDDRLNDAGVLVLADFLTELFFTSIYFAANPPQSLRVEGQAGAYVSLDFNGLLALDHGRSRRGRFTFSPPVSQKI